MYSRFHKISWFTNRLILFTGIISLFFVALKGYYRFIPELNEKLLTAKMTYADLLNMVKIHIIIYAVMLLLILAVGILCFTKFSLRKLIGSYTVCIIGLVTLSGVTFYNSYANDIIKNIIFPLSFGIFVLLSIISYFAAQMSEEEYSRFLKMVSKNIPARQ